MITLFNKLKRTIFITPDYLRTDLSLKYFYTKQIKNELTLKIILNCKRNAVNSTMKMQTHLNNAILLKCKPNKIKTTKNIKH